MILALRTPEVIHKCLHFIHEYITHEKHLWISWFMLPMNHYPWEVIYTLFCIQVFWHTLLLYNWFLLWCPPIEQGTVLDTTFTNAMEYQTFLISKTCLSRYRDSHWKMIVRRLSHIHNSNPYYGPYICDDDIFVLKCIMTYYNHDWDQCQVSSFWVTPTKISAVCTLSMSILFPNKLGQYYEVALWYVCPLPYNTAHCTVITNVYFQLPTDTS